MGIKFSHTTKGSNRTEKVQSPKDTLKDLRRFSQTFFNNKPNGGGVPDFYQSQLETWFLFVWWGMCVFCVKEDSHTKDINHTS